jgi:hypothetical protein
VCGIRPDGELSCWTNGLEPLPSTLPGRYRQVSVSGGSSYLCAVRLDGGIVCWADNDVDEAPAVTVTGPAALPGGLVPFGYTAVFSATGGTAPYRFHVVDGLLPPVLALRSDGLLDGPLNVPGVYTFMVRATDERGLAGYMPYTLPVSSVASRYYLPLFRRHEVRPGPGTPAPAPPWPATPAPTAATTIDDYLPVVWQ